MYVSNINNRLPWWLSNKEPACQCREQEFKPWSRKISHVVEKLSLCSTTTKVRVPREPMLHNRRSRCWRSPHTPKRVAPTRRN